MSVLCESVCECVYVCVSVCVGECVCGCVCVWEIIHLDDATYRDVLKKKKHVLGKCVCVFVCVCVCVCVCFN